MRDLDDLGVRRIRTRARDRQLTPDGALAGEISVKTPDAIPEPNTCDGMPEDCMPG